MNTKERIIRDVVNLNLLEYQRRFKSDIDMKWAMASSGANICDEMYKHYKKIFTEVELAKRIYNIAMLN